MKKLQEIINEVLDNRGKPKIINITSDSHLRNDIGFDSLDLAELTVRIEAEYGIDVFEDGLVFTVKEIEQKLNRI